MTELVWYRSLYWRIALGFVALLAVLLAVQGLVFLYLTGRTTEFFPGRSPAEYAQTIAVDLSLALAADAGLNLDEYLNGRYTSPYRPFVVVTTDGRVVESRRVPPPPQLVRQTVGRLAGGPAGRGAGTPFTGFRRGGAPPPSLEGGVPPAPANEPQDGRGRGFRRSGRGGLGQEFAAEYAPVLVDGLTLAMVAVPVQAPPVSLALRSLGPTLALVAAALLVIGVGVAALVIFGPSHRRMRSLQRAAQAVGSGDVGVRAPAGGGDEVALLAQSFNEMASGLEERTKAVRLADEARRRLLADVSHELMTPLAAIRGYAETLAMPAVALDAETRQRYLRVIGDEAVRLEHIVGDLLDLARVENRAGAWTFAAVPVSALFDRVRERHEGVLRERGLSMEQRIDTGAESVRGDAKRLEQVLQNLAANAVRHTPSGGAVRLLAERVAGGVSLIVEDTGPGIPPEHLAHVFDRFYKVDAARTGTDLPSGSGLGLSIVQAIVARHGGRVTATNRPGGGARFEVVLFDDLGSMG
jgi:signal transduction histidine kinase